MKKFKLKNNTWHSIYYQFASSLWDLIDDSTEASVDNSMGDSTKDAGYSARDLIISDLREKFEKKNK